MLSEQNFHMPHLTGIIVSHKIIALLSYLLITCYNLYRPQFLVKGSFLDALIAISHGVTGLQSGSFRAYCLCLVTLRPCLEVLKMLVVSCVVKSSISVFQNLYFIFLDL